MTFQHFPHTYVWGCKFDLVVRFGRPRVPNADSKVQPQSCLDYGEEDLYGHVGHLFKWRGTIRINFKYPLDRTPKVKSGENYSEENTFTKYSILSMYIAQGQEQITPRGHKVDCN